jgi:hypothetical protein
VLGSGGGKRAERKVLLNSDGPYFNVLLNQVKRDGFCDSSLRIFWTGVTLQHV